AGHASLQLDISGTARAPRGTLEATVDAMAAPGLPRQRIDIEAAIASADGGLSVDSSIGLALGSLDLLSASATVELPGALVGKKAEPQLDVAITIPERKLSDFGSLAPIAGKLDGVIGGKAFVRGTPKAPSLSSSLSWKGYRTASGAPGSAVIALSGDPSKIDAKIDIGYGGAAITAAISPGPTRTSIRASARANQTQLATLVPAALVGKLDGIDAGRLSWDMDADIQLDKSSGKAVVERAVVRGLLTIDDALFVLPGSDRRISDVDLHVAAVPGGIKLERFSAREKDDSKKVRAITGNGFLALARSKPVSGQLQLKARDWLVFDGKKFGTADAPRAEIDFDIGVKAELARQVPRVVATVSALSLRAPERYDRHHQPLDISPAGDLVFLDDGQQAGLLATVSARPAAPVEASPAKPAGGAPLDIVVEIPRPIRLHSAPLDVYAKGRVEVSIRPEGQTTTGKLIMTKGTMDVFGAVHKLSRGSFEISPDHPKGHLDLEFRRQLPPAIARTLSKEAVKAGLILRVQGSPDAPALSFDGAADSLLDFMAMHNAGRGTAQTGLGVAASQSVQAPRGDQPMVLTFIGSNLPHLLFLDRFTAWSSTGGSEYGRVRNFEGESYSKNQRRRVRVISRERQIGRSEAEVQVDRLLINGDRAAVGVGVRAGSRIGGGVGVFVEWSSDD
ncbi:MAG: translocation/assembly module TamB domain-containing protein, partial [Deltaproteobacteria bacterium]|nr:translocation/assembly module TamB domain-containing protein [Deltaproteobacteria bacterium]